MDSLNTKISFAVLAVVVFTVALTSGGKQKSVTDDPWFKNAVLQNSQPVVVKFGADWCGPCRGMDEAIDSLKSDFSPRAKFLKIDIDKNPELFAQYRSGSGIPQVMIFRNGQVVAQQRGFGGAEGLKQWLDSSL